MPELTERIIEDGPVPLVIVEGFLGGGGPALWGNFEEHSNHTQFDEERPRRRVIFASVGPVSSLHDRACELYYALKGGAVDYGDAHARANGHSRYGRTHTIGMYPEWSDEAPLHFIGHSLGAPTIIKLQWLISTGFFGDSQHPDMVLSVTAISAPFRGTQAVYALGERIDCAPSVRPFSIGSFLAKGVHVASYLSPFFPTVVDLHTDARSLSCDKASFRSFLKHLWSSDWAEGRDAAPFDVTLEAADEREMNFEGLVHPSTFYRSFSACMTERDPNKHGYHVPRGCPSALPLYALSTSIGSFEFSSVRPVPSCIEPSLLVRKDTTGIDASHTDEVLWANDGVVPLFSQWHPLACRKTRCRHHPCEEDEVSLHLTELTVPEPGIWQVYHLENANHFSLAPFWFGTTRQRAFWRSTGRWLQGIDRMRLKLG